MRTGHGLSRLLAGSTVLLALGGAGCGRIGFSANAVGGGDGGDISCGGADGSVVGDAEITADGAITALSCTTSVECDDDLPCNGIETCHDSMYVCLDGTPLADGTSCGVERVCRAASCAPTSCGNGVIEGDEDCDDENTDDGDGCDNDCTFSCIEDTDCRDGVGCNGEETCGLEHACLAGAPPPDGTPCGGGRVCMEGDCVPPISMTDGGPDTDGGAEPDGGGEPDAGECPATPSSSMSIECFKRCESDADCVITSLNCCCGCAQGGTEESINGDYLLWWPGYLGCGSCTGISCPDVYNCSGASPACLSGQCTAGGVG